MNPKEIHEDHPEGLHKFQSQLQDGQLYILGETAGGNTIFRWDGKLPGSVVQKPRGGRGGARVRSLCKLVTRGCMVSFLRGY